MGGWFFTNLLPVHTRHKPAAGNMPASYKIDRAIFIFIFKLYFAG